MIVTLLIAAMLLLTSYVEGMEDNFIFPRIRRIHSNVENLPGHKLVAQESLDLSRTNIQDKHLKIILENNYETLKNLDLSFCRQISFKKISLDLWKKCTKLEMVNLAGTKVPINVLQTILNNNPDLSYLDISCCNKTEWRRINGIKCKNLRILKLGNTGIEVDGLNTVLRKNPNITHLNIHGCKYVYLPDVDWKSLTKLESLSLGGIDITHLNINFIAEKNKNLKHLDLRTCKEICWQKIEWYNAKNLTTLCLSATNAMPDDVCFILAQSTSLKYINVYKCKNIDRQDFEKLEADFPECYIAWEISDRSWEIAAGKSVPSKKPSPDFVEFHLKKLRNKKLKK